MSRLSLLLSLILGTGRSAPAQTCAHTRPTQDRQAVTRREKNVTSLPRPLTAVEGKLVLADNRFTLKLFRQIAGTTPTDFNLVVSPFSVATALTMAYNGAAGRTRDEMQRALSLEGLTLQDVNEAYRSLPQLLRGLDPQVCFQLANSAWYRPTFTPLSSFLDAARAYFGAQVRSLDFDAASAAPTINAWVSDNTAGRIKAIVPNPIPADVRMSLVNAVYFKGSWSTPFDSSRTHPQLFRLATGDTTMVQMMVSAGEVGARLYQEGDVTVLDLPYGGRAFSMTIVLPPTPSNLDSLVWDLSDNRWSAWIKGLAPTSLLVSLPRFTISSAAALNTILGDLGMRTAFCGRWASDFTRLDPSGKTCISDVLHGGWVQVNEEGTEAAAATLVFMAQSLPPTIVVDRPFVFAIRERFSGAILFLGKVMNPAAS